MVGKIIGCHAWGKIGNHGMFSLIRLCKVEGLSRNWQDIHHEQGGKLFRLLRKENWVWNTKIWLDRKLKLFCYSRHLLLATYWQVWLFKVLWIQIFLQRKELIQLTLTLIALAKADSASASQSDRVEIHVNKV